MNKPFSDTPRQDFGTASDVNKTPTTTTPSDDEGLREALEKIILLTHNAQADYWVSDSVKDIMALISEKILEARLDGRIEAGKHFRGYMISTSPFIEQVLNPYLTEQRQHLKATLTTNQATKYNEKEDK